MTVSALATGRYPGGDCKVAASRRTPKLMALFVGEVFVGPIRFEVGGENEQAKVGETHVAEYGEGGTDVGAMVHGTAATVDDEIRRAGERCGPGFDLREAVGSAALAVELRAFDMSSCVEAWEADEENCRGDFWLGELFVERGGLDGLCVSPRIRGILCMRVRQQTKSNQRKKETNKRK